MKSYRPDQLILNLILTLFVCNLTAQATELQSALRESYAAEKKGNYNDALKSILEIQIRDSRNYFIQMRVGYLNMMLGQYTTSLTAYENATLLESNAVEPAIGALKVAILMGNWSGAETWAMDVLRKDPNNYVGISRLAYSYLARKDYAQASKYYQKVVDLYPTDTEMKGGLAWSLYYMGNKPKARVLFEEILAVTPDDASARQGMAASQK